MAVHANGLLNAFIYGFSYQEKALTIHDAADPAAGFSTVSRESLDETEYHHLREANAEISRKGYDFNDEYAFAVDVILDAIGRLRERPDDPS
jgi:adenine-specific DNA methylase